MRRSPLRLLLAFPLIVSVACNKSKPQDPEPPTQAPPAEKAARQEPPGLPAPPDVKAPPADAQKTASGLASKVISPGTGTEHPGPEDQVRVHYTGWTTDGKMFDSSVVRNSPASFGLNQVIKGWTEGVQLMSVGERFEFAIPADLAYGTGRGPIPNGAALFFKVELIAINPPETAG